MSAVHELDVFASDADGVPSVASRDQVAIEAPLLLRLRRGGVDTGEATLLMRTPGHDEDLVRGFLFSEGLLRAERELLGLERPEGLVGDERGNIVIADLSSQAPGSLARFSVGSSSCGACGKTSLASLNVEGDLRGAALVIADDVLRALPGRMAAAQPTFLATGGVHASALFSPGGDLVLVREDVGRHNALDKVIGWALRVGALPLTGYVLVVSGRVSYDLAQKAILCGVPVLAAVGAPSSYAVTLAERAGLTLVGFLRPGSQVIYTAPHRVTRGALAAPSAQTAPV